MKTINSIFLLSLVLFTFSCDDILEEDITDSVIQTIAPQNNEEIESNVVSFRWNTVKGADKYRLQIYSSTQAIALDSLVSGSGFTCPLLPGAYQWRVRGENFGYQSAYCLQMSFSVIETDDLTNQQVTLANPASGFYTNAASIVCSWQGINVADSYDFELVDLTNGQTIIHQQSNITTTNLTLNNTMLNHDAEYQWRVRAVNSTSQTPYATRRFLIDRVNPNPPLNSLPATNSTQLINQSINFSWNPLPDTGVIQSPVSAVIEFSNDSNFTSILLSSPSVTASFQQTFTVPGTYFWRIKMTDLAGNSVYNTPFKFTIN